MQPSQLPGLAFSVSHPVTLLKASGPGYRSTIPHPHTGHTTTPHACLLSIQPSICPPAHLYVGYSIHAFIHPSFLDGYCAIIHEQTSGGMALSSYSQPPSSIDHTLTQSTRVRATFLFYFLFPISKPTSTSRLESSSGTGDSSIIPLFCFFFLSFPFHLPSSFSTILFQEIPERKGRKLRSSSKGACTCRLCSRLQFTIAL